MSKPDEQREAGEARSIEEGAQSFLSENRAPVEIEADWTEWINKTGTAVWDRQGLSRAQRSIATISILSVTHQEGPLRVHVEAGLANGLSRLEISEVIMHSAVYAGVPQALRSMQIAYEVFAGLDARSPEAQS